MNFLEVHAILVYTLFIACIILTQENYLLKAKLLRKIDTSFIQSACFNPNVYLTECILYNLTD